MCQEVFCLKNWYRKYIRYNLNRVVENRETERSYCRNISAQCTSKLGPEGIKGRLYVGLYSLGFGGELANLMVSLNTLVPMRDEYDRRTRIILSIFVDGAKTTWRLRRMKKEFRTLDLRTEVTWLSEDAKNEKTPNRLRMRWREEKDDVRKMSRWKSDDFSPRAWIRDDEKTTKWDDSKMMTMRMDDDETDRTFGLKKNNIIFCWKAWFCFYF